MRDLFTRNLGWKLFSLVVAIFLWITFVQIEEAGAFVSAPIEYRGMPDDLEIASDILTHVSLDVRGPADQVQKFNASPAPVILDFSPIRGPGLQTFPIGDGNVRLPQRMHLVRSVPAQVRLQFEKRGEREVPVQARFTGLQPGFRIARFEINPDRLTILGPASRVSQVQFAVTDPIDLTKVIGAADVQVYAFVGDAHVRFQRPSKVQVRVFVENQ